MKNSLIGSFLLALFVCQGCITGSTHPIAQPENKNAEDALSTETSEKWKNVSIASADLQLSLPPKYSQEMANTENNKNGSVTWTDNNYNWRVPREDLTAPNEEIDVFVTTWDKGFPPLDEKRPIRLSPEEMLELDYRGDLRGKESGDLPIEEVAYLELDGVRGEFLRYTNREDKNIVTVSWQTYRHYNGNGQRINIIIQGVRRDVEEMTKIIKSVKFAKK